MFTIVWGHLSTRQPRTTRQFSTNSMNTTHMAFRADGHDLLPAHVGWAGSTYQTQTWCPPTLEQLARALEEEQRAASALTIRHLTSSMQRRRQAVLMPEEGTPAIDFDNSKEHEFHCLPNETSIIDSSDLPMKRFVNCSGKGFRFQSFWIKIDIYIFPWQTNLSIYSFLFLNSV